MKKSKAKTRAVGNADKPPQKRLTGARKARRGSPSPKMASRSKAFAEAMKKAKSYANDPERLRALFKEAAKKAQSIPKDPFKETWAYFQAMLRLIRAYYRRDYRDVTMSTLVLIIAAIIYVLNPFDLIPDAIPVVGWLDDATVLAFAVRRTRQTLDDFMAWETTAL